jgi:hypothetical protein
LDSLTLINGNGNPYKVSVPHLTIITDEINEVALKHIEANTGIKFEKGAWNYEAQPERFEQIAALLLTYNFKTQYHDNGTTHNTILLKFCYGSTFKTDSICFDCCEANRIATNGLNKTDRLAV